MWTQTWLSDIAPTQQCTVTQQGFPQDARSQSAVYELEHSRPLAGFTIELSAATADDLGPEGYQIDCDNRHAVITAASTTGWLYAAFRLIALVRLHGETPFSVREFPANGLRMLNHWDNLDGSIERGYSGNSFFFENDTILLNDRTRDYARMLCSVGINGIVINNVNVKQAACDLIRPRYLARVKELNDLFASYGIRLFLSLNYAASMDDETVQSADPLEPAVQAFWKKQMDDIYACIPDLGGFLVKADSEGRPGPFTYGRSQADGANMLADAIRPHGGIILWRCFVYNCQQDWRDTKTDRACSAHQYFAPLDGQFADNVILQIKNGPMDFQVREPVSPLFGTLTNTNQMIEFQIAQEYTGQQRHVCYLIPWFKEVLSFNTYAPARPGTDASVASIVAGRTFGRPLGGMCAVANTGNDENWTGHDLAAANLYGFARLAFDPQLTAEAIADEWIRLTFGSHPQVVQNIGRILAMSWPAYEKYTSPLGIGWMVTPNTHYGPDPDGYEYSRWGTYHRSDHLGIGVDRSDRGTGYARLYREPWASLYNDPDTCPEELLLFFHHMPYQHRLQNGKTILQHIYDTHFEGAEEAQTMAALWDALEPFLDPDAFHRVQERFTHQVAHAAEWRDVINSYFYRKTLIPDEQGRKLY